ncbi:diacylglycerol/lipid kinase family protein [Clostridium amazonitimonense]|uniref:diacylglycerol/lipid kinase family protein n=1 Tax=Clostridium amazonitimonense TaxID=1499689 RepID=UPI000509AB68|nr:diacylglycerol kinase family protein [Clostridium amazonitimonense]
MKHLFIINPVAGKGKAVGFIQDIKEYFDKRDDYFLEVTKRQGHAADLVREYVSKDTYRVYSIGGDGTLNEVLNGLVGSNSSLAVIPAGSGNDFIKSIIQDENKNYENILERTIEGEEQLVDLGSINYRYFINISSVGFDAVVTKNARNLKKKPLISGSLAYLLSIFSTIYKFRGIDVDIYIDGVEMKRKAILIAIANGKYYGGGMKVAPNAEISDGNLDICVVNNMNRLRLLRLFPKLIDGTHGEVEEVEFFKGKDILIKGKENFPINIDGEILEDGKVQIQVREQYVKIVKPRV